MSACTSFGCGGIKWYLHFLSRRCLGCTWVGRVIGISIPRLNWYSSHYKRCVRTKLRLKDFPLSPQLERRTWSQSEKSAIKFHLPFVVEKVGHLLKTAVMWKMSITCSSWRRHARTRRSLLFRVLVIDKAVNRARDTLSVSKWYLSWKISLVVSHLLSRDTW